MLYNKNFFIHSEILFKNFLIKKSFTKYIYIKLVIDKQFNIKKKKLLLLENSLNDFFFQIKKKFFKLKKFFNLKKGMFLKRDLFVYKHSKLKSVFFHSLCFRMNLKKNIFINFKNLKFQIKTSKIIFLYKNIRGGFLGFSNKICGYIPKILILKFNKNLIKYKKFCLIIGFCLPKFLTNFSSFIYRSPILKKKKKRRRKKKIKKKFYFKKLKFFFFTKNFYFKKFLFYFLKNLNFLKIKNLKYFFFNTYLNLYKLGLQI